MKTNITKLNTSTNLVRVCCTVTSLEENKVTDSRIISVPLFCEGSVRASAIQYLYWKSFLEEQYGDCTEEEISSLSSTSYEYITRHGLCIIDPGIMVWTYTLISEDVYILSHEDTIALVMVDIG